MTDPIPARLARGDGIALWRKLEAALVEEIGRLPPGGNRRLPTERELAERFSVNRHTVRQAIRALVERGLVRTEQGRGMFAADVLVDYALGPRTRFSANLLAQDRLPGRERLAVRVRPGEAAATQALGLPTGSPLVEFESIGLAEGVPLTLGRLFLPAGRFPDAVSRLEADPSITGLLAAHGIADYRRRQTRLHARLPREDEAALLRQPPVEPVLVTEALDVDPAGRPLTFSITVWSAARVQFTIES